MAAPDAVPGAVRCTVAGVALLGPGLEGWERGAAVLAGRAPWEAAPLALPPPALLAPTERRRTSQAVRLALAVAAEAAAASGLAPDSLETVFASSNGDGAVVGAILEALHAPDGAISPTQFHNSVHNAAAGYWGIGAGSTQPSISLGGHDDAFPAGLLHAAAQVAARRVPVLFCAYDMPLPPPLDAVRPTTQPFATALVLTPAGGEGPALTLRHDAGPLPPGTPAQPGAACRALEAANPIARALPLLEALARREPARLVFPLAEETWLVAELAP
ncbi:beta-ketoacyl synthase chain length factor [Roseomonas sp. OT10]|uniref:beta-ketoacyl synthase chain length factor n=1 Tax=Roseomonas cutis TaxID=2897332 RepID=UPI001E403B1D|nr:beta-ketoacyl synthase chain length factor [Roseomonas sp. OT10]UFN48739.1 beta-ketoacyl synthase chain length factor [Roseomonas sp. OT10]